MAAKIPPFAIGANWATVSITPQLVGNDGTLTDDGTAISVVAQMRRVNMRMSNSLENLTAMGRLQANNVAYENSTSFTLEYIIRWDDSGTLTGTTNPLTFIALTYVYVKLQVARAGVLFTYYGVVEEMEEEGVKERGTGTITFAMVDPGDWNPTYTTVP